MSSTDQSAGPQLSTEASAEVDRLNERALQLELTAPVEMLTIAQQAHELAVTENYARGIVRSLISIGSAQGRLGRMIEADQAFLQAQASDALDLELEAELNNVRGRNYFDLKIYDKAFSFYWQSLSVARRIGDRKLETRLLNNIGIIYRHHKAYAKSLEYLQMSVAAQDELTDFNAKSIPVANIGLTYLEMGDLENAKLYLEQAIRIAREQNARMAESFALQHLGVIARRQGQREQAIGYLNESLAIYSSTQEKIHAVKALLEFHRLYFDEGNAVMSMHYLNEALRVAEEGQSLESRLAVYSEFARVYESLDDIKMALQYHNQCQVTSVAMEQEEREQRLRAFGVQIAADESSKEKEAFRALSQELDRKARDLEEAYLTLQAISDIGKNITATLDLEHIFALVYQHLTGLMQTDVFGIGLYSLESNDLEYQYFVRSGKQEHGLSISLNNRASFAVACFKQQRGFLINSLSEDVSDYVESVSHQEGIPMTALMFQPLAVEAEMIGVMMVQSSTEHVYTEHTLALLGMLAAYLSIAIQNARKSEKLREEIKQRELAQQELQRVNSELASLSERDGLTNIANWRRFNHFLQHTWDAALRQQLEVSLLMIDIDCFKEYNDSYGHLSGDGAIKQIAQALQKSVKRDTDLVARYGGDEFVVLLDATDATGALQVAQAIRAAVESCGIEHRASRVRPQVTISVGVATMVPSQDTQSGDLITRGDQAHYQAKHAGRDRIHVFTD